MAKTVTLKPVTDNHDWMCWSAHAYGFDSAWWRECSMDGQQCRCSEEKIARIREHGREIMAKYR